MHTVNLFVFRVAYFLFASFILQISTVYALPVASYIEVPKSYQLYPRDIGSMTAQVRFAGTVTDTAGFNTFEIIAKRDGQPYQTVLLSVISGVNFNFDQTFSIVAELKSYSFVVRMKNYANQYRVQRTLMKL